MKSIEIPVPFEALVIIWRTKFEVTAIESNMAFLLNKNANNKDYVFSEEYNNVLNLYIEKTLMYDEVCAFTVSELLGTDAVIEHIDLIKSTVIVRVADNFFATNFETTKPAENTKLYTKDYSSMISSFYKDVLIDDRTTAVKTVTFQVTDACNLNCSYCYQKSKGNNKMEFEIAKELVDKILTYDIGIKDYISSDNSIAVIIQFIGGEPFLEVELIDKICDYFQSRLNELRHPWLYKYMYSISSNGTLYENPEVQKFLQKHVHDLSLTITVDGTQKLHDSCRTFKDGSPSYAIAHHAATDWMKRGHVMGSKITLAPQNIQYFNECLQQMMKDGFTEINANTVYEDVWCTGDATILFEQCQRFTDFVLEHPEIDANYLEISYFTDFMVGQPSPSEDDRNWCGGTGSMLAIDPAGNLYPCIRYMESSISKKQEPFVIGNVYDGIGTCEKEQDRLNHLSCITRSSQSSEQCLRCPIAGGCGWCSGYNYECFGTANKRTTFTCDMHKSRSLSVVYYYNMLYKNNRIKHARNLWCPEEWAVPIIGKEKYNDLVALTQECGCYVNTKTQIDIDSTLNA